METDAILETQLADRLREHIGKLRSMKVKGWKSVAIFELPSEEGGENSELEKALPASFKAKNRGQLCKHFSRHGRFIAYAFFDGRCWNSMSSETAKKWLRWFSLGYVTKPFSGELWEGDGFIPDSRCTSCGSRWIFHDNLMDDHYEGSHFICKVCGQGWEASDNDVKRLPFLIGEDKLV